MQMYLFEYIYLCHILPFPKRNNCHRRMHLKLSALQCVDYIHLTSHDHCLCKMNILVAILNFMWHIYTNKLSFVWHRYNTVQYNTIAHTVIKWQRQMCIAIILEEVNSYHSKYLFLYLLHSLRSTCNEEHWHLCPHCADGCTKLLLSPLSAGLDPRHFHTN